MQGHLLSILGRWAYGGWVRQEFLVAAPLINKYWFLTYLKYSLADEMSHFWPPAGRGERGRIVSRVRAVPCNRGTALHVHKQKDCIPVVWRRQTHTGWQKDRYTQGQVCTDLDSHTRNVYIHIGRYTMIQPEDYLLFHVGLVKACMDSYPPAILFTVHPLNLLPLLLWLSLVAGRQLISALSAGWLTFTAVAVLSRKVK